MNMQGQTKNGYGFTTRNWYSNNIKLTYACSEFTESGLHKAHSDTDMVRLHFGVRGNYSVWYKQLNRSYSLLGGHYNLIYTQGFDMEFVNRTNSIETFGIQFPKQQLLHYIENATDNLKRFAQESATAAILFCLKTGAQLTAVSSKRFNR